MGVTWLQDETLRSDHAFVSCELLAVNISLTGTSKCSQARWEKGASWEDVTARIDNALKFIAGWAARLLLNQVFKALGCCREVQGFATQSPGQSCVVALGSSVPWQGTTAGW